MRKIGVGTFVSTPRMHTNIVEVLRTNRVSYGPFCRQLEQRFAKIHDSKFAVLSNSGTDALRVALAAMKELHGWRDGDEVLVPAVTFVATVNVVLQNNLKPVLVDVESDYYGIDVTKITPQVTNRTRAVIPVHLFGMPCDMESLYVTVGQLKIIEDSCECMFVKHCNEMVGSWSEIGCFSMYVAHLMTAGVGGISITSDPDYAGVMRSLVNHGRDGVYIAIDDDDNVDGDKLKEIITKRFYFERVGYSARITEFEAAIAVAQLDDYESMIKKRQENAAYLTAGLKHLEDCLQLPRIRPETEHAFMMYPIVLKHGNKWLLCNYLEERGIETREMLRLTDQPVYLKMGLWNPDDYPVAKWINEQGFYVGCHQELTREDLDYVLNVFNDYFTQGE